MFKHNCFYWVRINSIDSEWTVAQFYGDGLNYFTVLGADTFYPNQLLEIGPELGYGPVLQEN